MIGSIHNRPFDKLFFFNRLFKNHLTLSFSTIYTDLHRFPFRAHLRSLCKNNRKSSTPADQLIPVHAYVAMFVQISSDSRQGTICNVVYTPGYTIGSASVMHESRDACLWYMGRQVSILPACYTDSAPQSSMRPDIAHRLACCDNLSSCTEEGGGVYV